MAVAVKPKSSRRRLEATVARRSEASRKARAAFEESVRVAYAGGLNLREIGAAAGISHETVRAIVLRA